jgi:UPF0755 protein
VKLNFKIIILTLIVTPLLFIGPYFAFLNHKNTSIDFLDVLAGESIYSSIDNVISMSPEKKMLLKIYLKIKNIKSFKAGEYYIKNKKLLDIISDLHNGKYYQRSFTIPDGSNIFELEALVNNSMLNNNCSYLSCIYNKLDYKEGMLLPNTFFYYKGHNASDIFDQSYDSLMKFIDSIWMLKPDNNLLNTKYEAIILASIIEKEAGNFEEKNKIASVFLARLKKNMRLQADPTIIYGLLPNFDGDIKKSDILNKRNTYNTYMINGLPPSPIAFASKSSLQAAILSSPGDYFYFVANSKNSHYFSKTYDEHKQAIKRLGLDK